MEMRKLVHVGFGNVVVANRIIAIIHPDSSPVKRLRDEARERGQLIDATQGRKTRAVILTDSHVILTIQPETIAAVSKNGSNSIMTCKKGACLSYPDQTGREPYERNFLRVPDLVYSISCTTRSPRR